MTNMSKILMASALTLAFAAPAFADESATLRERNAFANPAGVSGQVETTYGTEAFASTRAPVRMEREWMMARPTTEWSDFKDQGIKREH